jgi:hypothetical protein
MKSIETKFAEACDALRKANKFTKFREVCPIGSNIEAQLNCAEAVLTGKVEEAETARRTVRKHNGAGDNGSWFAESANGGTFAEKSDPFAKADTLICESLGLSDADTRRVLGRAPAEIESLGAAAVAEYKFCLGINLTEAQAIVSVKKTFSK